MNLIRIYGNLKYQECSVENGIYQFGGDSDTLKHQEKLARLIDIVEYKLGLITQDEMKSSFFDESNEKNDWLLHSFSGSYKNDSYHYYRACKGCGNKWFHLHSRYERKYVLCGECK